MLKLHDNGISVVWQKGTSAKKARLQLSGIDSGSRTEQDGEVISACVREEQGNDPFDVVQSISVSIEGDSLISCEPTSQFDSTRQGSGAISACGQGGEGTVVGVSACAIQMEQVDGRD